MANTSKRVAGDEIDDEPIGELEVAEYLIFMLALDTYVRYVEEATGIDDPEDPLIRKGLRLLRIAEMEVERISSFLEENLPTDAHRRMLQRAIRFKITTVGGASRRALHLRTVLSRGGAATQRAIFKTNRALRQIREATAAAMLDDADAALDKFAALPMRNARLRDWIDNAAATAGSGETFQNSVESGANESSDQTSELMSQQIQQIAAPGAESAAKAAEAKTDILTQVEHEAQQAAKRSMDLTGEEDLPITKSEAIGLATAAAAAATSDPSRPQNVPEPLRGLDDDQRAAAMTDGKVLVGAGAGAGKSTTLVSRIAYLVKDRRVLPSRILATSFNNKAAKELEEKIGRAIGGDAAKQMSIGTMHSLFKKFVMEHGNREEKIAMGGGGKGGPNGFVADGKSVSYAVQKIWDDCFPDDPKPKLKTMLTYKAQWAGNNVSPAEAMSKAQTSEEVQAARWYEMYEGLKGSISWRPPCPSRAYESFMGRNRPGGIRLGDFSDMLSMFRDILKRDPRVRTAIQKMFDHIIVDEAQDRNTVMAEVIDMISEHITDGSDGKALWIVGDDKQAINSFMGARSELFTSLYEKEGWKTRTIRTNYRCAPEIVEAGNKLIAHNDDQIPMEAVPSPGKARGASSIKVSSPVDEADAALETIETIKQNLVLGANVTDHAVLCRTNKELHAYETACIIRGVPYARKGASSFLGSPETSALLGYVQLVTGTDYAKMQKSLGDAINKPNRFFLSDPKKAPDAVKGVFEAYARRTGVDVKSVNPIDALQDSMFIDMLARALARLTRTGRGYKFEQKIEDLGYALLEMKAKTNDPDYTTKQLFDDILGLRGTAIEGGSFVDQTFRESIQADLKNALGDEEEGAEEEEDDADGTKGLGNISFLYQLAQPDPTDEDDDLTPPDTPAGFKAKMERYASKMRDLRTDVNKWYKEQASLPPERRSPPPGVYLGTVHSTKGAEWKNVTVAMPANKFPMMPPVKPGEPPPPPEEMEKRLEDERRLGYVALTRAINNLTIVCPQVVGGKPAGVSPFVSEAGLSVGENVTPQQEVKTARLATYEDFVAEEAESLESEVGYDYSR